MKEAFGTDDHMKVALIILDKGELEVSGTLAPRACSRRDSLRCTIIGTRYPTFLTPCRQGAGVIV